MKCKIGNFSETFCCVCVRACLYVCGWMCVHVHVEARVHIGCVPRLYFALYIEARSHTRIQSLLTGLV